MESKNRKYTILQPALLALMVVIGMIGGYQLNDVKDGEFIRFFPGEKEINVGQMEEALRFLDSKYLYDPDKEALTDDALRQVFSRLDPYSLYISPSELPNVNNNLNGNYYGIGIETIILNDTLLITNVLENSPAMNSGLKKLDRILALNGEPLTNDDLDFPKFRQHFQSNSDSSVIQILRSRTSEEMDIVVASEKVETRSIKHYMMLNDTLLYVRIDQFNAKTYREFMEVLEKFQIDGDIPGLILDMRNNPGGYLGEVTKILSQFFDESERLLVKTQVRNGRERKYETTGRTFYNVGRIIALINENSASGSEVLAGALQDWDRALVIGKQSYGKGLVQEQYPLSNGGAVRLTVANYYLPSGRSIQQAFELDSTYFDADTVWNQAEKTFSSLIYQRPLTGAQGIIPDIVVPDSIYDHIIYPGFYSISTLDEVAISYVESHPELFVMDQDDYTSSVFIDIDLKERERLKEETDSLLNDDYINLLLKAKVAEFVYENQMVLNILMKNDPVLVEALRKMNESNWFNE